MILFQNYGIKQIVRGRAKILVKINYGEGALIARKLYK